MFLTYLIKQQIIANNVFLLKLMRIKSIRGKGHCSDFSVFISGIKWN